MFEYTKDKKTINASILDAKKREKPGLASMESLSEAYRNAGKNKGVGTGVRFPTSINQRVGNNKRGR